jgi:hypothetical protein
VGLRAHDRHRPGAGREAGCAATGGQRWLSVTDGCR